MDPQRSLSHLQMFQSYDSPYIFRDRPHPLISWMSQYYIWLQEALIGLMLIITAWTGVTLKVLIGFFMSLTALLGSRQPLTM